MLHLPLKKEQLEELNKDSIIDMSVMNFNNKEFKDDVKSSLIFFRNTGIDVHLDFSNCSYEQKRQFLLSYLTEDIRVTIKELASTWGRILTGEFLEVPCILNDDEYKKFKTDEYDSISYLSEFIRSIPTVCLSAFKKLDNSYTPDWDHVKFEGWFLLNNLVSVFRYMDLLMYTEEVNNSIYVDIPERQRKYISEILMSSGYVSLYSLIFDTTKEQIDEMMKNLFENIKEDNDEDI